MIIWSMYCTLFHSVSRYILSMHDCLKQLVAYLLFREQYSFLRVDLLEEVPSLTVVHHNIQAAPL